MSKALVSARLDAEDLLRDHGAALQFCMRSGLTKLHGHALQIAPPELRELIDGAARTLRLGAALYEFVAHLDGLVFDRHYIETSYLGAKSRHPAGCMLRLTKKVAARIGYGELYELRIDVGRNYPETIYKKDTGGGAEFRPGPWWPDIFCRFIELHKQMVTCAAIEDAAKIESERAQQLEENSLGAAYICSDNSLARRG